MGEESATILVMKLIVILKKECELFKNSWWFKQVSDYFINLSNNIKVLASLQKQSSCNPSRYCDADATSDNHNPTNYLVESKKCDMTVDCPDDERDEDEATCPENYCISPSGDTVRLTRDMLCNAVQVRLGTDTAHLLIDETIWKQRYYFLPSLLLRIHVEIPNLFAGLCRFARWAAREMWAAHWGRSFLWRGHQVDSPKIPLHR